MKVAHATPAAVAPTVLEWAMSRADSSVADLASALNTSEAVVTAWLDGRRRPSFVQTQRLASHLRLPFGFMFLPTPPPESLPIPDFRTVHGQPVGRISLDLRDVILAALRRQSWLSEYRKELDEPPLAFVGSAAGTTSHVMIARSIRDALKLNGAARPGRADDFLRFLVERTEAIGVAVLRSGIVGMNTSRKLDASEFRGFSISDPYAPLVFINSTDAKVAQSFTLMHELAHIWLGQSGISGSVRDEEGPDEALCNRVAAEVLVPGDEFDAVWDSSAPDSDAIAEASRHFRVSRFVVAIRAQQRGLLSRHRLEQLLDEYTADARAGQGPGGGDFYRNMIARNGRVVSEGVITALSKQHVLIREASSLLEVQPAHLGRIAQELRRE